jgi:lysophospholipase L1-like esterase
MRKKIFGTVLLMFCLSSGTLTYAAEKTRLIKNLESGKSQVVVAYGTSLTEMGAWVKQVNDVLQKRYPGLVKVINSGGSGQWSEWGVKNLETKVLAKKPDTVFIEFSINDSVDRFKASVDMARNNLNNMIDRILKQNADCEIILMVMNPVNPAADRWAKSRSRLKKFNQMYRDVAKERNFLLIDHYPKWQKILDKNPALFSKYVPDGLHPGPEGCLNVVTPEIIKALGIDQGQ